MLKVQNFHYSRLSKIYGKNEENIKKNKSKIEKHKRRIYNLIVK